MKKYIDLKNSNQQNFDRFPIKFAFTKEQMDEVIQELGQPKELLYVGGGGYIRKSDRDAFHQMLHNTDKNIIDAIANDNENGDFCYDMFLYELDNHEYCVTWNARETLEDMDFIKRTDFKKYPQLLVGLERAKKEIQSREVSE